MAAGLRIYKVDGGIDTIVFIDRLYSSDGPLLSFRPMCNLYSITRGQQPILEATRAMVDRTGKMPPLPGVFPDYLAPIVRNTADGRELAMARRGTPSSKQALFEAAKNRAEKLEATVRSRPMTSRLLTAAVYANEAVVLPLHQAPHDEATNLLTAIHAVERV